MPEPTVLGMMKDQMDRIEANQDKLLDCMTDIKIKQETNYNKIKSTKQLLEEHCGDKEKHYNPYHNETYGELIRRKQPEILTGVTLSSIISGVIIGVAKAFGVI